ncbi:MAG: metal ABC transporter permease [Burkholderiales bacterium]
MTTEGLQAGILFPAFVAGLLVLLTHVPLGMEVLKRGIIFIDLAVAQFAGFGIVAAHALGAESHGWQMQIAALAAALAGAFFLRWREKRDPAHQEAVIGVSFVAAACATILVLAKDPQAGEHMKELLVGQILWTPWTGLAPLAIVTAAVLALRRWTRTSPLVFYLAFAFAITASVQIVGVYLVFASLIVPALAARGRPGLGYLVGISGYAAGLLASALFDLPSGATIVLGLVLVALFLRRSY